MIQKRTPPMAWVFFPDIFIFQGPGRLDSHGVIGAKLRHIVADGQKENSHGHGNHLLDPHRKAENDSVGSPGKADQKQGHSVNKNIKGLLMERVAFLPWIDIGQQLHEKEQDTGQRRKEQGHVFVGIAVDRPVKAQWVGTISGISGSRQAWASRETTESPIKKESFFVNFIIYFLLWKSQKTIS